jgi:hypothetical protein
MHKPKFKLGKIVATPDALQTLERCGVAASQLLARHVVGDWGDTCPEDAELNEQALLNGSRLMSVFKLNESDTVWAITEADRSSTCLLLPENY